MGDLHVCKGWETPLTIVPILKDFLSNTVYKLLYDLHAGLYPSPIAHQTFSELLLLQICFKNRLSGNKSDLQSTPR